MKYKWDVITAGVLFLSCLSTPFSVSATAQFSECTEEDGSISQFYSVESETFSYRKKEWEGHVCPSHFETDVANVNCIVTGVFYYEDKPAAYTINALGSIYDSGSKIFAKNIAPFLDDQIMSVGDVLYIDPAGVDMAMIDPPIIGFPPENNPVVEYYGSGVEIFGEDFKKVIRHELWKSPLDYGGNEAYLYSYSSVPVDLGNMNDDDSINLLDVIAVNRYLMIGEPIGFYGQLCADVNNDGQVTSTDALHILRKVVGLIDSFEEVQ